MLRITSLRPTVRWICWTGVLFCVSFLGAISLALFLNLQTKGRAEDLLRATRAIKTGESTTADVQRLADRFHGRLNPYLRASRCPSADSAYGVQIENGALNRLGGTIPFLRRLGLRPWGVAAMFLLQGGRVCFAQYAVGVYPLDEEPIFELSATALPLGSDGFDPKYHSYSVGKRLHRGVCYFESEVAPEATPEEKQHAFAFDFSCTTTMRGCLRISELAPLAWSDFSSRSKEQMWVSEHGEDKPSESYCK
jgi:hypothetical protein